MYIHFALQLATIILDYQTELTFIQNFVSFEASHVSACFTTQYSIGDIASPSAPLSPDSVLECVALFEALDIFISLAFSNTLFLVNVAYVPCDILSTHETVHFSSTFLSNAMQAVYSSNRSLATASLRRAVFQRIISFFAG